MNIGELKKTFSGDIDSSPETLTTYSHDASLFTVRPTVVVYPKHAADISALVVWAHTTTPAVSLTMRAAGTCMSGGSINESVIVDTTRYMNSLINITDTYAVMQPGLMYRDFETAALKHYRMMPAFTASKNICAVGGMFGNNSGGEKSIKYGKMEDYIIETKCIFSDGHEYIVRPLNRAELDIKMKQGDFEGNLYKSIFEMIDKNYNAINHAKPNVSKNSAGYYIWNVWNPNTGIFDLNKLLVGSQGTLALVTEMTWKLVPIEPVSNVLAIYMKSLDGVGDLAANLVTFKPDSIESFDDYSLRLAFKFFFDFLGSMGIWKFIKLGISMIPDGITILRGGIPKLIMLVEVAGTIETEVRTKLEAINTAIKPFGHKTHICRNSTEADKYWRIRRESFNLLRKHIHGKRTAPFIDDIIVDPKYLPEFMPKIQTILDDAGFVYTIAGHVGNGNFHIIPLLDMHDPTNRDLVLNVSDRVYDLVLSYGGSITAEHNDGIIRTPYLEKMYGPFITGLFKLTKGLFDPQGIFNPGKKTAGTRQYLTDHINVLD